MQHGTNASMKTEKKSERQQQQQQHAAARLHWSNAKMEIVELKKKLPEDEHVFIFRRATVCDVTNVFLYYTC